MRRSLAVLLTVASLFTGPMALAARSSRAPAKATPPKDELGKKESSVAPDKSLAGDITRHKATKEQAQPTLKYDQFRVQVELQVASKRHEQIEYLQKIIQLGADDKEMPGLLFRLAELYWEESRYYFFESNRKDDEIFAAQNHKDAAGAKRATEEKNALVQRSQKFQAEAVGRYKEIVSKYPKFPRMDEVLYFLGHNLWDSNKEQDALAIYKTLITRFPKSKYIPDAWLAFGEFYFNGSQGKKDMIGKALASYKHATAYQDSGVYGFALYKEAWCQYNLGNFSVALDLFKQVIFYGELATSVNGDNKTALVKQARSDYVLTYSHFGDPLGAEDDFKKVGGPDNWMKMFKGLAGLYYDDGKDKEAVLSYKRLITLQPLSPDAPFYQARIVDAVIRVGRKQITLDQVRALVKITQDVKKAGTVKTDADKKALASAEDLAERIMSNLAVNWHNEAKKTRDEQTFVLANEVYSDYLGIFPDGKKSYDLRFFWAELLNDNLQKFDKAAENYSIVVAIDAKRIEKKQKPGKWLTNASYDAILAWDQVVKKFETTEQLTKSGTKPSPIPPLEQKLLDACEAYIKYVPKGDKVVEVEYKVAQIYYRYNHLDEASKRFDDLCENHSSNELAEYSCNLVVDTKNLKGDLQGVYDTAKKYLSNPALIKAHPKLGTDLKTVLEETSFKLVSQLEAKGRYVAAAKKYLGYVDEFPKGSLSDTALFNASVDFFKGHHFDDAIAARARLAKEFPGSKFVPDAIFANGEAAESVGDFSAAAGFYEEYAGRFQKQTGLSGGLKAKPGKHRKPSRHAPPPQTATVQHYDEAKAQVALYNAGVFREGLGEFKRALANRNLYLDMWPNSKDSESVFLSIASLYEHENANGKAIGQYLEYEKRNVRDPSKVLTGEANIAPIYEKGTSKRQAVKKRQDIYKYYGKLHSSWKKKIEGAAIAEVAMADFEANEPYYTEYARIKLHFPPDYFKKALKEKAEKLKDLQRRYTVTVAFKAGGPAICALTRIGDAYAQFESALKNVPLPKGLSQDQQDGIREGLEQQAGPLHQKASEAYQTAVSKSRELNVYNDCAEKALGKLSEEFAPAQFPKVTETFGLVKGLPERKEGQGLLTSIQPIPTPADREEASAEPLSAPPLTPRHVEAAPTHVTPASSSENPSDAPPSEEESAKPEPAAAEPVKTVPATAPQNNDEPTDSDLVQ